MFISFKDSSRVASLLQRVSATQPESRGLGNVVCKINMRMEKVYLQLVLQRADRILNALQEVHAQARAAGAVHRVPGLDEPGKIAEFSSARGEQIRQDLGVQGHPATIPLGCLRDLGERRGGRLAFLLILGKSDQLTALLGGGDAPWRRLGNRVARLGRLLPGKIPEVFLLALPQHLG